MSENHSHHRRNCLKFLGFSLVIVTLGYLILVSEVGFRLGTRLFVRSAQESLNSNRNADQSQDLQTESAVR